MGERRALFYQAIKIRGVDIDQTKSLDCFIGQIIRKYKQDIGTRAVGRREAGAKDQRGHE